MNEIAEKFFALSEEDKKKVHISMADLALRSWKAFVENGDVPQSYRESVVGTHQEFDVVLPDRALEVLKAGSNAAQVLIDYQEPICAMQDEDLVLGDDAEMAYYAIYNTIMKYVAGKQVDDWLIVNQALSSLGDGADIFTPLRQAIDHCEKLK